VAPGSEPAEVTPAGVESIATSPTLDGILHMLGVDALAVDMFIKIDGIDGEATAGRGHEDVDAASPHLYQACANGKHYPTATLVVRKAGEPFDYFSIRLQDVRVSSVKLAHSTERDVPMEEVTLNYGKITWSYDPQDAKDGKVEKGWDLKANKGV
jgi:type VI protein secretion system component Hcp